MDMEMMFKVGGKKDELDDEAQAKVARYVEKRVGDYRCPDHDKAPTVIVSGTSLSDIGFEVKGCSQKVIHLVKARLEG